MDFRSVSLILEQAKESLTEGNVEAVSDALYYGKKALEALASPSAARDYARQRAQSAKPKDSRSFAGVPVTKPSAPSPAAKPARTPIDKSKLSSTPTVVPNKSTVRKTPKGTLISPKSDDHTSWSDALMTH